MALNTTGGGMRMYDGWTPEQQRKFEQLRRDMTNDLLIGALNRMDPYGLDRITVLPPSPPPTWRERLACAWDCLCGREIR